MKTSFKRISRTIGHHFRILTKGCIKVLWGTTTAVMIAVAVYGYKIVPTEGGYAAVCDFLVATLTMVVALACMYLIGGNCKKGAKK